MGEGVIWGVGVWGGGGGVRICVTYGLRTTAEKLCEEDFERGDSSLLYLTPGIFGQKCRNSQCVKIGKTKGKSIQKRI